MSEQQIDSGYFEQEVEVAKPPVKSIDFQDYELKIVLKALEILNDSDTKWHWRRYDSERTEKYKKQVDYIIRKIKRLK